MRILKFPSQQLLFLSGLAIGITFLCSCSNYYYPSHHFAYAPGAANTPFLKEKNETHLTAAYMAAENDKDSDQGSYIAGANLRGAYAVSKNIGIIASYFTGWEKDKYNSSTDRKERLSYRRHSSDLGVGYFTPVSKSGKNILECYAGYGFGKNSICYSYTQYGTETNGFHRSYISRFFLQPGFTMHIKNTVRLGAFIRTSLLKYYNISTSYSEDALKVDNVSLYNLDKTPFLFIEPCAALQFPLNRQKSLNGNVQLGASAQVSGAKLHSRKVFVGGGLMLDLSKR